jgi:hypothetical protein
MQAILDTWKGPNMSSRTDAAVCLNCNRTETDVVLVALRYRGQGAWICHQCFPTLIHKPERLAGRLENAAGLHPAEHQDG